MRIDLPQDLRVLIIEDDERAATAARMVLQGNGMRVDSCGSLAPGLRQAQTRRYDAVLLDLGLPETDGIDTVEVVRARVPEAAIVVITGSQDESLARAALERGAQEHLVKGNFAWSSVSQMVEHAVVRHRLALQVEQTARGIVKSLNPTRLVLRDPDAGAIPDAERARLTQELTDLVATSAHGSGEHKRSARGLSAQLGSFQASAREVVDLYIKALAELHAASEWEDHEMFSREGLIVLVEVLGELSDIYRTGRSAPSGGNGQPHPAHRYTVYVSSRDRTAVEQVEGLLEAELDAPFELEVVDVEAEPERAEAALVLATPTIVREAPGPQLRLQGQLISHTKARLGLALEGTSPEVRP